MCGSESCTIDELFVLRIAEVVGHGIDDIPLIGSRARGGILHLHCMAGILHQSCHSMIIIVIKAAVGEFHLRPLESSGRERTAGKAIATYIVRGYSGGGILWPLPIEHNLCHSCSHAASVATAQIVVVWAALVPFGLDEVADVVFRCSCNVLGRLDVVLLHVLDLLLVFLKEVLQAWR